jgi:hypothetical protein
MGYAIAVGCVLVVLGLLYTDMGAPFDEPMGATEGGEEE